MLWDYAFGLCGSAALHLCPSAAGAAGETVLAEGAGGIGVKMAEGAAEAEAAGGAVVGDGESSVQMRGGGGHGGGG